MNDKGKRDWISPKVEIREIPDFRKGMVAKETIKEGEKVVVWKGIYTDIIGAEEAKKQGKLIMQWDDNLYSVETRGEDRGYFVNHSCDSNLWMSDAFTLIARRDIKPGEEITADYALWEADENWKSRWECRCKSPLCRYKITGKDWRNPEIQKRYKGHFSPLLNKRISQLGNNK